MRNWEVIVRALGGVGYLRSKGLSFKATWSSDAIQHFIYLHTYGTPKDFLAANFGIRNPLSEEFSMECMRLYGGELFSKLLDRGSDTDCKMNFDFGHLYNPTRRWQIYLPQHSDLEGANILLSTIEERLLPVIRPIVTLREFCELLLGDERPCRWSYTNGAIRAAQVISIARQLHIDLACVLTRLESRMDWIKLGLNQNDAAAARTFLENVTDHSASIYSTLH